MTVAKWPVAEVGRVGRQAERTRFTNESRRRARELIPADTRLHLDAEG